MKSPNDYQREIEKILDANSKGGKIEMSISVNSKEEAKAKLLEIRHKQKELKFVKKDISVTVKAIRSAYTQQKSGVGSGIGASLNAGLFGKKTAGKMNSNEKERLRQAQAKAVAPYEGLSRGIDGLVLQMDAVKLRLEAYE